MFNPLKRHNAEQLLTHSYLAALHDPTDEPVAPYKFKCDVDNRKMSSRELRDAFWEEMVKFHPEINH